MSFAIDLIDPEATPDPELLALVQIASTGPPYDYAPGELAPATDWVPPLIRQSVASLVARDAHHLVVGYVLVVRLADHPDAREAGPLLGVHLESTCYLAELGVASSARHQGLGTSLVEAAVKGAPAGTTSVAVRTLVDHHTAIRLYQRCGFRLVTGVRQTHRGRPRLFLVRTIDRRG